MHANKTCIMGREQWAGSVLSPIIHISARHSLSLSLFLAHSLTMSFSFCISSARHNSLAFCNRLDTTDVTFPPTYFLETHRPDLQVKRRATQRRYVKIIIMYIYRYIRTEWLMVASVLSVYL